MGAKKWVHDGKLTEEQKEKIRKDFREFSGGYHPGEAGEEHIRFVEEYEESYGDDVLDSFLTQWGEEESEKDLERSRQAEERRKDDFKKKMQKLASSFVTIHSPKKSVVLTLEDPSDPERSLVFQLAPRESQTAAKAEAADLMWAVQLLLERGAAEWRKR